jgi:hypothetical protein
MVQDAVDGGGKRGSTTRVLVVIAGAVIVALAAVLVLKLTSGVRWAVYESAEHGFEIRYPSGWSVVRAVPLNEWKMDALTPRETLVGDELEKVSFIETDASSWQGILQVRVLANPESLSLDEWIGSYRVESATGASLIRDVTDTTISGEPAKKLVIFGFDHQDTELIVARNGKIHTVTHATRNPNDPEFERHLGIYRDMAAGFRFTAIN